MSKDTIYREDAIKALCADSDGVTEAEAKAIMVCLADVLEVLRALPSVHKPQGEWVPFEYGDERWHKCTACGVADKYIEYVERPNGTTGKLVAIRNYCPNCGARMKSFNDTHTKAEIDNALKGVDNE